MSIFNWWGTADKKVKEISEINKNNLINKLKKLIEDEKPRFEKVRDSNVNWEPDEDVEAKLKLYMSELENKMNRYAERIDYDGYNITRIVFDMLDTNYNFSYHYENYMSNLKKILELLKKPEVGIPADIIKGKKEVVEALYKGTSLLDKFNKGYKLVHENLYDDRTIADWFDDLYQKGYREFSNNYKQYRRMAADDERDKAEKCYAIFLKTYNTFEKRYNNFKAKLAKASEGLNKGKNYLPKLKKLAEEMIKVYKSIAEGETTFFSKLLDWDSKKHLLKDELVDRIKDFCNCKHRNEMYNYDRKVNANKK